MTEEAMLRKIVKQMVEEEIVKVKPSIDTILLDDIARGIKQILTHLCETTSEGVDIPLPEKTVTSAKPEIIDVSHIPLRKVDFFNKGPNTAYYRINNDAKEIPIEDRETIVAERPRATIETITLRVDAGNSAIIKMVGSY